MKNVLTAGAALLLTTTIAQAGGLDRSGQGVGVIFEEGTYAELSFGYIMPEVSGSLQVAPSVFLESGNVGVDYLQLGAAFKNDLNDQISYALIIDQPYGANVAYTDTDAGYPLSSTDAEFRSVGLTLLGRYKLNENISFHGGVRSVTISADTKVAAFNPMTGAFLHTAEYESDTAFAAVLGAAYEIPDIALRVALTYTSAMDFSNDTEYSLLAGVAPGALAPVPFTPGISTDYTIPQSVNLDMQTGIAADTLLFGSIRWVEWTETLVNVVGYPPNPLVSYDNNSFTYNIGIGRRFSDEFSGSFSIGYEEAQGGLAQNLAPTDGNVSFALGGAYTLENGVEVSGGIRYVMIGDATTTINAEFEDNHAIAVGMKIGYNF